MIVYLPAYILFSRQKFTCQQTSSCSLQKFTCQQTSYSSRLLVYLPADLLLLQLLVLYLPADLLLLQSLVVYLPADLPLKTLVVYLQTDFLLLKTLVVYLPTDLLLKTLVVYLQTVFLLLKTLVVYLPTDLLLLKSDKLPSSRPLSPPRVSCCCYLPADPSSLSRLQFTCQQTSSSSLWQFRPTWNPPLLLPA